MKRIKTALVFVMIAGCAAAQDLAPEELLPVHADKDAYFPAAAFGKDGFLVAWQAGRIADGNLANGKSDPVGIGDIVACRVDKSGKTLDTKPFVVSGAADLQEKPRLAFAPSAGSGQGGDVFLVVWQDMRNGKDYDVYAARVSVDGKSLDPDGVLICGGARNQAMPDVTYDGGNFLVVWQDFRSGKYAVHGARVDKSGKVLDADGIVLGDSGKGEFHRITPVVNSLGDARSVVFWAADSTMPGRSEPSGGCFVKEGKVAKTFDFKGHHYAAPVNPIALAVGPRGFLLAWRNNAAVGRGTPSRNANAAFFSPEGEKEASDEKGSKGAFRIGGNIADPSAAWDGERFVIAWHSAKGEKKSFPSDAVSATTISVDGQPSDKVLDVAGTKESPACGAAVASDRVGLTLIAYERHPSSGDVPIKVGVRMLKRQ
ncbi:MAG: hypothetical protein C0404_04410 [Verrucomicrobia bacterium]|nr:hypothetical protein [Verrucomicrobiota bacterium]